MNIIVRNEEPKDHRRTEEVAREAFWNLYFPGAAEHYVVHKMRSHPDFIQELAFVIEVDGTVEGAIFYTHSKVVTPDREFPTISFGPVFISPKYHRQGLGRKLITHSIEKAKVMGYSAILTLGYPYHYEPYGFRGGKNTASPCRTESFIPVFWCCPFGKPLWMEFMDMPNFLRYWKPRRQISLPSMLHSRKRKRRCFPASMSMKLPVHSWMNKRR